MWEPSVVSQSSPATPSVLRAGSGFETGADEVFPEEVVEAVVDAGSLTEPDSPSPDTEMSFAELMSLPETWIPTLLSKPQLFSPDEEQVAVTRLPLIS
jgi:hypothetical protein